MGKFDGLWEDVSVNIILGKFGYQERTSHGVRIGVYASELIESLRLASSFCMQSLGILSCGHCREGSQEVYLHLLGTFVILLVWQKGMDGVDALYGRSRGILMSICGSL